jgi:hypothetical protein
VLHFCGTSDVRIGFHGVGSEEWSADGQPMARDCGP